MSDFGPVLDGSGRPLDQIRLLGVSARGRHGVLATERLDGQDFVVDAVLHLDVGKAAATDDLAATVDYGVLATRIADIVRGEPVDLIETLAHRLAAACLEPAGVQAVDITVHKPRAPIRERFADVAVAVRRERLPEPERLVDEPAESRSRSSSAVSAVLALGANLGDRLGTLRRAVAELEALPGVRVDGVSPVVETAPVGRPDQPDYMNAVVLITTDLPAHELLRAVQGIEADHGRERMVRWGPRTLDVDVIRYGDQLSDDPGLTLPHPRAAQRAFVLAPWLAADPRAWLPGPAGRRPIGPLLEGTPDRAGVRERPDLELRP
jgi:dihydroneopterin aldolase/2-amino-4-hydroxy-6-hydroxymethyldihydropteridine diphosphokinase